MKSLVDLVKKATGRHLTQHQLNLAAQCSVKPYNGHCIRRIAEYKTDADGMIIKSVKVDRALLRRDPETDDLIPYFVTFFSCQDIYTPDGKLKERREVMDDVQRNIVYNPPGSFLGQEVHLNKF